MSIWNWFQRSKGKTEGQPKNYDPIAPDGIWTPIRRMMAAIRDDDLRQVQKLLVEHEELWDYRSSNWVSLLAVAARSGRLEIAKYFIDSGIDVNQVDDKGLQTALRVAVSEDQFEMAKMLLERGADPNLAKTAFAAIRRDDESEGLKFIQLLESYGMQLDRTLQFFREPKTILEFAEDQDRMRIAAYIRQQISK